VREDDGVSGTASRLLELLSLLQARRYWPGPSWPGDAAVYVAANRHAGANRPPVRRPSSAAV